MGRSAGEDDLPRVAALLAARGETVSPGSLRGRLADDDGGILLAGEATCSWALDGGALHLYDLAGDLSEVATLLGAADAIARARFAAVLTAALYENDPALGALRAAGFIDDWEDADVRAGVRMRLVGIAREVS